jgi:ABC-type bacteriocin/lantibiotic exporter with double-glycine peptidase domain
MCGPACLKVIATYFGKSTSTRRIARACRTSRVSGTTGPNLVRGAQALGLAGRIVDGAGFRTIAGWLKRGVPVVVDWMSPGDAENGQSAMAIGHYSVVCGLTRHHIILEDPALGRRRRVARKAFFKVWFDFLYAYPRSKNDLIIRRAIAIAPETFLDL